MAKRMLIDATHAEETRVVVVNGSNRLEDFDYEIESRKQLKGNIYLAKVTRVEPSLQAAFVDYGGNRHGFLPFSEIHPDYYRIPIADRQALLAEEAALDDRLGDVEPIDVDEDGETGDRPASGKGRGRGRGRRRSTRGARRSKDPELREPPAELADEAASHDPDEAEDEPDRIETRDADAEVYGGDEAEGGPADSDGETAENGAPAESAAAARTNGEGPEDVETATKVDTVGGDEVEEARRSRASLLRRYKIQEVIKRRQVLLVQVTKEERGNKGAALTTYLSLAGRYCVLMPNTNKGGGISRKIANAGDRRRLKSILSELKIPEGIAVIVRTAGSERSKAEIRRDYEYLLRLWDEIRETTLKSTAPSLIYEEANLIKRAIRDLYTRDMDEILVEGEEGYKAAKAFMKSLMPSHAKKVKLFKDDTVPLFNKYKVESQLDAMHSPVVQLKSGGYIVLNATEALVAIDVNSGKATRERHIEETALRTNLEAAEEVGRQLRLRDLAGLIVIDFIDMEENRHNREVERRLKEALKHDRARIQLGRISPFGLLEMSRQRLRPSLVESVTMICPQCAGTGHVRTIESTALHVLRGLEDEGIRRPGDEVVLTVPSEVALYIFNQKRARLLDIENRYGFKVRIDTDDKLVTPDYRLERITESGQRAPLERPRSEAAGEEEDDSDRKRGRKRRGRKRREDEVAGEEPETQAAAESARDDEDQAGAESDTDDQRRQKAEKAEEQEQRKRRRRGKRGGRRRAAKREDGDKAAEEAPQGNDASADVASEAQASAPEAAEADSAALLAGGEGTTEAPAVEAGESKPARRRGGRRRSEGRPKAEATQDDSAKTTDAPLAAAEETPGGATSESAPTVESGPHPEDKPKAAAEQPQEPAVPADSPMPHGGNGADADEHRQSEHDSGSDDKGEQAMPDDQPVQPEPQARAKSQRPKRSGWWSKFL